MNNHKLDFLSAIQRKICYLVAIDAFFKASSYFLGISIVTFLLVRIFGVAFLSGSYLLFLSLLVGLISGAFTALLRNPSLAHMVLASDIKFGLNHRLSAAYECSKKIRVNSVEGLLVSQVVNDGQKLASGITLSYYNPKNFHLFLVLLGIMMIVRLVPNIPMVDNFNDKAVVLISDKEVIIISQGLSEVKNRIQGNHAIEDLINDIEMLIKLIHTHPVNKNVLLERVNKFIQNLSQLQLPERELVELQVLLEKLLLWGSVDMSNYEYGSHMDLSDISFSFYNPGNVHPIVLAEKLSGDYKSGQFQFEVVIKNQEEAFKSPYLPYEYKDIIKEYFSREVKHEK